MRCHGADRGPCAARSVEELRDAMLEWLAAASSLPAIEVLPAYRWLCEARGCSFEDPTAECLRGVLDSLRALALAGGAPRAALEAQLAPFRHALAEL
jgi:hypothetical protein